MVFLNQNDRETKKKLWLNAHKKYRPYPPVNLKNRDWPNRQITKAPKWCSVDLRDGNQALVNPMNLKQKEIYLDLLMQIGFKIIEIGFPSASETEYNFIRFCIDNKQREDLQFQVLTPCRPEHIKKTFNCLSGAKSPIIHFYNPTSRLQRDVLLKSVEQVKQLAIDSAKLVLDLGGAFSGNIQYAYSPESFTGTELEVALEICNAVIDEVNPTQQNPLTLNFPATVECSMPNVYADQIEWMCRNLNNRENLIVSLHTHNDRGCAVAASEMGLLAGADRVEGTLFGNGERTGNADLVTLALNLFSQGIDPELNFSNLDYAKSIYEECTKLRVPDRQPYAGELVYTAFSGSHQDAIYKGLAAHKKNQHLWNVPYLPIDPKDVGKSYDGLIRINSQSGKGGITYILEQNYGFILPRFFQDTFRDLIKQKVDKNSVEFKPESIIELLYLYYIIQPWSEIKLKDFNIETQKEPSEIILNLKLEVLNRMLFLKCCGINVLEAALQKIGLLANLQIKLSNYNEQTLKKENEIYFVCYVELNLNEQKFFGVGFATDKNRAQLMAMISALNYKKQFAQKLMSVMNDL